MPIAIPLIAAMLIALAVPAAAPAATKQRVGGFVVTWPDATTSVRPGDALRIVVRRTAAAGRPVARVRVLRLAPRRRLRSVTVRRRRAVVIRPAAGVAYRVRVTVGRSAVGRRIETAPPSPALCGATATRASATLTPGVATAEPGQTLPLTLRNTGGACFRTGLAVALRRADGTEVPLHRVVPAIMLLVEPGETVANGIELPADLAPGSYRAVMTVWIGPEHPPVVQEVAAEFTVAA
jgi:hypothetical protein